MQYITLNNKKIFYQIAGKGNTIVLLHGFLNSSEVWNFHIQELSKKYQVIAIDLPGHGNSERISDIHSMDIMSSSVKTVLDSLNIQKCILLGHSMGGYITLNFVENYPEYIVGFGLVNSTAMPDSDVAKNNRLRVCKMVENEKLNFITAFIPDLFAPENVLKFTKEIELLQAIGKDIDTKSIIAAQQGMMQRESKISLLENTKLPMLFIGGKKDKNISQEIILSQAMLVNNVEVLLLPTGHMGHIEAKEETAIVIESFANRCYSINN